MKAGDQPVAHRSVARPMGQRPHLRRRRQQHQCSCAQPRWTCHPRCQCNDGHSQCHQVKLAERPREPARFSPASQLGMKRGTIQPAIGEVSATAAGMPRRLPPSACSTALIFNMETHVVDEEDQENENRRWLRQLRPAITVSPATRRTNKASMTPAANGPTW